MLDQLRYNRKDLVSVVQLDDDGNIVNEFKSIREAERITGVRNSHITSVCKGKRPKAGSFVWKYKHSA